MNSQKLDNSASAWYHYLMMQPAEVHKNASIAIIIYFIQNLQLSNSVVGAELVMLVVVVDHLNHATTTQLHSLPCWSIIK